MALLSVRDVTLRFGGIVALDGVSFDVEEGHISGLIGPNGAGKTTAFNVITRLYKPDAGAVELDGESILASPRRTRSCRRASRAHSRTSSSSGRCRSSRTCSSALMGGGGRRARKRRCEVLDVVGLEDRAHFPAAALPYGTQKRVELARALVAKPRLLLLDEPAGGLNHEEVAELGAFVRRLREDLELTILLVEHHMNLVMCDLRPRQRAELRPQDRRRPARAGASRPRGDRGLPRERGRRRFASGGEPDRARPLRRTSPNDDVARARSGRGALRPCPGPARRLADGLGGRGRRRARCERRRQDHDSACDLRHGRAPRDRSSSTARSSRVAPRQPRKLASPTSRRGVEPSSTSR